MPRPHLPFQLPCRRLFRVYIVLNMFKPGIGWGKNEVPVFIHRTGPLHSDIYRCFHPLVDRRTVSGVGRILLVLLVIFGGTFNHDSHPIYSR
jgi:hypothetical protein